MNEYPFEPMWSRDQCIDEVSSGWNLISGVFMALCLSVVCVWIAIGNMPRPVTADVTPLKMYHIGDYGLGRPTYGTPWSDVGLCALASKTLADGTVIGGEIIYYPHTDVWRCE